MHLLTYSRSFFALTLAGALAAPSFLSAQSILLSAGDFTLLGGTAITSTGVTGTLISNGNVGLSPGPTTAITGFPPAVIANGAIIETGGVTGQARLDLIKVSNALALMPSDENLSNQDLAGMTLAPGVYTFDGAANLNGTLILDAQGQNGVYWVFQISTALNTSVDSSISFVNFGSNGGSDIGLFWNAGTTIITGANNQLAGNFLSGTSITLGAGSSGGGRALALSSVTLDNNQLDAFGGAGGSDYTGGLQYDLLGNIVAIPEPASDGLAFALLAGLTALCRRNRRC